MAALLALAIAIALCCMGASISQAQERRFAATLTSTETPTPFTSNFMLHIRGDTAQWEMIASGARTNASIVYFPTGKNTNNTPQELATLLPTDKASGLSLERIPILRPTNIEATPAPTAEESTVLTQDMTHHYMGSFRESQLKPGTEIMTMMVLVQQIDMGNVYIQVNGAPQGLMIEGQLVAVAETPAEELQSGPIGAVMGGKIKSHHPHHGS